MPYTFLEKYDIEIHNYLNPSIWEEDGQLRPKIR